MNNEQNIQKFYKYKSKIWDLYSRKVYKGHIIIEQLLLPFLISTYKILDLGCGTGSMAFFLSQYAKELDGVDISFDMIKLAHKRNIYSSLHQMNIIKFLQLCYLKYDIIISVAVLIHFKQLDNLFNLVRQCIKLNGLFIFSIFLRNEKSHYNIGLTPFSMISHKHSYIIKICEKYGYKILSYKITPHKYHNNKPIMGAFYITQNII